eukprot:GFUD01012575.1.p1 GENE.GFUD01012575.1~~GFUD01012575.1.p1  ORF type:complete len:203 (-),score=51.29 GFUD01012575.1:88-651(-)
MDQKKETCLGVFSLLNASWIIAIIQLFYNVFIMPSAVTSIYSVVQSINITATSDHTNTVLVLSCSYYTWSAVCHILGMCAAILLILSHVGSPPAPSHLLTWLLLTSFHPLLYLLAVLDSLLRGNITVVAGKMIHSGLPFLLTMYSMHLMYSLYRQMVQDQEYHRLYVGEEKGEMEKTKSKNCYQSII